MMENFDPSSYKKFDELPEEKRDNFVPVEGGGFVLKRAVEYTEKFKRKATNINKRRPILDKILNKGKYTDVDVMHSQAQSDNDIEMEAVQNRELRKNMPENLKRELKEAIFQGAAEGGAPIGDLPNISVNGQATARGIREACEAIYDIAWGLYSSGIDDASVSLQYKGQDTEAEVFASSNVMGLNPNVNIKHKDKEYNWVGGIGENEGF